MILDCGDDARERSVLICMLERGGVFFILFYLILFGGEKKRGGRAS